MLNRKSIFALAFLATSALATAASAADYLTGYVGYYDFNKRVDTATQFGLEYRGEQLGYWIRPIAGISDTTDSSVYGYAGIDIDIPLIDKKLYLVPNFAPGLYSRGSSHKDLGGAIEFRSGLELDYQFDNAQRLGAAVNHVSNASIYDHNPGTETLMVTYSVPIGTLMGH
jgi:opacity protein-like surface antigen